MLDSYILLAGFLLLMYKSVKTFSLVRNRKLNIEEIIPATSFGVSLFGIGITLGIILGNTKSDVVLIKICMIAFCWITLISGLLTCRLLEIRCGNKSKDKG